MLSKHGRGVSFSTTLLLLGSSCYSNAYVIDADREVGRILRSRTLGSKWSESPLDLLELDVVTRFGIKCLFFFLWPGLPSWS